MKLEKTRLKLSESQQGELIGFVSRHGKRRKLFGVREDSPLGKKVCVLSEHLKGQLKPDKLYEVEVKPMRSSTGYVIVTAEPILFSAKIEVAIEPNAVYQITLKFGNKTIYYDPLNGQSSSSNSIDGVLNVLEQRDDIADKKDTLQKFVLEAGKLLDRMVRDGVILS